MSNLLIFIYDFLTDHFNEEELKDLCFRLAMDYEDLPAIGRRYKGRELVKWLARRNQIPSLLTTLAELRPESFQQSNMALPSPTETLKFLAEDTVKNRQLELDNPYYNYYSIHEHEEKIAHVLAGLYDKNGRSVTMISGLGGIGKTAVTLEIIRRTLQDAAFPFRAITWNSAKQKMFFDGEIKRIRDSTIDLNVLQNSLGQQLIGPTFISQQDAAKEAALREILHDQPTLLIVDNLETIPNASAISLKLQGMLGRRSRLLLTSREVIPGDYAHVRLHGLSMSSTAEFLHQEIASRKFEVDTTIDIETMNQIHAATGGMPLALKLVISQAERIGLARTLSRLETGKGDIYRFIYLESWRLLHDLERRVLVYLGPLVKPVSRGQLDRLGARTGSSPEQLDDALEELIRLSLVNTQHLSGFGQIGYSLHQLTRQFVVNDLPGYWQEQGIL